MLTGDTNKNREVGISSHLLNVPRDPLTKLLVYLGQVPTLGRRGLEGDARTPLAETWYFDCHCAVGG